MMTDSRGAVWNRTMSRAHAFVKDTNLNNVRVYESWESMIGDRNLDAISIAAAPQLRVGPVIRS